MYSHLCFQYDHCTVCLLNVTFHYYWTLWLVYHWTTLSLYHCDTITCTHRLYFMPICCVLLAFTPLINLHYFLIYAVSFSVQHPLAGGVVLSYLLISDGNRKIILVYAFFIYAHFSGTQLGCKTRPWCTVSLWSVTVVLLGCSSMQ